jgi:hypothetical protein
MVTYNSARAPGLYINSFCINYDLFLFLNIMLLCLSLSSNPHSILSALSYEINFKKNNYTEFSRASPANFRQPTPTKQFQQLAKHKSATAPQTEIT